jgi:hypothetical protein
LTLVVGVDITAPDICPSPHHAVRGSEGVVTRKVPNNKKETESKKARKEKRNEARYHSYTDTSPSKRRVQKIRKQKLTKSKCL